MKNKKWIIGAVIVAVLAGGGYYYQQGKTDTAAIHYTVGETTKGNISSVVTATGTINPVHYVDVSTNVTGLLEKVLVSENEIVKKGQVIAYIDDSTLKANLDAVAAVTDNRRAEYERNAQLFKEGAISAQAYDTAKANYLSSEAEYRKAKKNVEEATIVAPMSGTIIGTPLRPGQTISQGLSKQMIICTIANLKEMEIFLSIDETDISKIKQGQRVDFTVDAYANKTFHGTVKSIAKGSKGNMGVLSDKVVYYTVKVAVEPDASAELLPTMTARASIYGTEAKDAILAPLTAVHNDDKGDYVYIIKNTKPEKQYVTTGVTNDSYVQITKGLKNHEKIVVSGAVDYKADKTNKDDE